MNQYQRLKKQIDRQVKRMKKAEQENLGWLADTTFIGTLGLVFVLPILLCAYIGSWLDESLAGYSIHWTLSLLFLGAVIGAINVYFLIRR
ncbi:MAG: AtpZ/AtpI family protein [Gammaproteobacteria bacterium]